MHLGGKGILTCLTYIAYSEAGAGWAVPPHRHHEIRSAIARGEVNSRLGTPIRRKRDASKPLYRPWPLST